MLLVVAAGLSRASVQGAGGEQVSCPQRALPSALGGSTDQPQTLREACATASQERLYVVAASLMGLVLISGLLTRPR